MKHIKSYIAGQFIHHFPEPLFSSQPMRWLIVDYLDQCHTYKKSKHPIEHYPNGPIKLAIEFVHQA